MPTQLLCMLLLHSCQEVVRQREFSVQLESRLSFLHNQGDASEEKPVDQPRHSEYLRPSEKGWGCVDSTQP